MILSFHSQRRWITGRCLHPEIQWWLPPPRPPPCLGGYLPSRMLISPLQHPIRRRRTSLFQWQFAPADQKSDVLEDCAMCALRPHSRLGLNQHPSPLKRKWNGRTNDCHKRDVHNLEYTYFTYSRVCRISGFINAAIWHWATSLSFVKDEQELVHKNVTFILKPDVCSKRASRSLPQNAPHLKHAYWTNLTL